jgi:hypothetical protein
LSIRLDGPDRVRRVRAAVARRIAEERGGKSLEEETQEVAGARAIGPSRTTDELAATLDPARVLG